jgi:hypothetical protein
MQPEIDGRTSRLFRFLQEHPESVLKPISSKKKEQRHPLLLLVKRSNRLSD